MRISRGRARFEACDPPASRLLKRSPHVGRHLRSEGSDVSVAELHNRDGKHTLCVHSPIFAVPSQRNAHHFQSSSLSEQADNGERFRSLSEPRRQRGKADPPRSARSAKVPPHHLQSASRQRPGQRRARRLGGPHGSVEKTNDLSVPYPFLTAETVRSIRARDDGWERAQRRQATLQL